MRLLFIGCVESSYILLNKLLGANANIVGVITKKESKFNADFVDLAPLCIENNIDYLYVKNINDVQSIEFVNEKQPDIAFCFGWSQLIKDEFLKLIPRGVVGFHPAELPYNRGRHPIIWALALGLTQTASTFFMIDSHADTGDIISQVKIPITYTDDAATLYEKIMFYAEVQVLDIWTGFENNAIKRISQAENVGNIWRKRTILDGQIDFRMSSRNIYNLVRSLVNPYPGAHFLYNEEMIKVWKVVEVQKEGYENIEPGKIIKIYKDRSFEVKTGDSIIRIVEYSSFIPVTGEYL